MSQRFYVHDGAILDLAATETYPGGIGGYLNLPAGDTGSETATTVSANFMGAPIDSVDIFMRAGWFHIVVLPPAP